MNTATLRVGNRASGSPQSAAPSTLPEILAVRNGWPIEQFRGAFAELIAMRRERGWSEEQFNGAAAELTAVPPRPDVPFSMNDASVPPAPSLFDRVREARAHTAPLARTLPPPVDRMSLPLAEDRLAAAQPRRAVRDDSPIPSAPTLEHVLASRRVAAGAA